MFAIGFLIVGFLFFFVLCGVAALLPLGKWRPLFTLGVLALVFAYPFLHLARPSYAKFKELCSRPNPPTIVKTKAVDFILLEDGYPSNCEKGPAYIAKTGYLGFDCNKQVGMDSRKEMVTQLYRYTKKSGAESTCGLACFDKEAITTPESNFGYSVRNDRARAGYLAGNERKVTADYPNSSEQETPFWRWLRVNDTILVDKTEGDMAFTTHYIYLPYGPIKVLGLASGSAPAEECPWPHSVDPREVYTPKHPLPADATDAHPPSK